MLLMLPALIAQTGLLSFISRSHLEGRPGRSGLKEIPIKEATMRRRLVVTYRSNSFLSPAAERLITLFSAAGEMHEAANRWHALRVGIGPMEAFTTLGGIKRHSTRSARASSSTDLKPHPRASFTRCPVPPGPSGSTSGL